ncbi:hypothetical protein ACN47E_006066 [Coniothyrium glycines]
METSHGLRDRTKAPPPLHSVAAQTPSSADIIIKVGTEEKQYRVHKAFLVYYSEYFSSALSDRWREVNDKEISLKDVEVPIFNLFVEWLYTQKLPIENDPLAWQTTAGIPGAWWEDPTILKLKFYVFADRFIVRNLSAELNRRIVNEHSSRAFPGHPGHEEIIYAFNNLPETDPLLDFYADILFYVWNLDMDQLHNQVSLRSQLPRELLLRFMLRVGRSRRDYEDLPINKFSFDFCSYHGHVSEEEKKACAYKVKLNTKLPLIERTIWPMKDEDEEDDSDDGASDI